MGMVSSRNSATRLAVLPAHGDELPDADWIVS